MLLFRPPGAPARDTTTSEFRQEGAARDDVSQPSEAGSMPGGTRRVRLAGELGDSQVSGGPSHGGGPLVPARASSTREGQRGAGLASLLSAERRGGRDVVLLDRAQHGNENRPGYGSSHAGRVEGCVGNTGGDVADGRCAVHDGFEPPVRRGPARGRGEK